MKKILVPVDFSQTSINALEYAAHIAQRNKGELIILHVLNKPDKFPGFVPSSLVISKISGEDDFFIRGIRSIEQKVIALSNKSFLKGVNFRFDLKIAGNAYKEIIASAREYLPDLIVMGTYGDTGFMKNLMGSVTARVIFSSEFPVLMVNRKIKYPRKKIIVFASDFSEEADRALPIVETFSRSIDADIHLLKVNTILADRKVNAEMLADFSKRHGLGYKKILFDSPFMIDGIIKYSRSVRASVIALVSHGRKGIRRWFDKNTFEAIRDFSKFSVLVITKGK